MKRSEIFESLNATMFQKLSDESMRSIVGGTDTFVTTASSKEEGDGTEKDD